jgi:hypothetical protein
LAFGAKGIRGDGVEAGAALRGAGTGKGVIAASCAGGCDVGGGFCAVCGGGGFCAKVPWSNHEDWDGGTGAGMRDPAQSQSTADATSTRHDRKRIRKKEDITGLPAYGPHRARS